MQQKHDSTTIINRIVSAAKLYKTSIVGKTFLVLYEGHSVEILFKTENFLHLCGVDTALYAKDFYKKAINGQLRESEIGFSKIHPYVFADIKTSYLLDALSIFHRDCLVITDILTSTQSFMLGATDLEVVFCFDSQFDANGNIVNDILIPYSFRVENIMNNKFNNIYTVDFVLSKKTGTKKYSTIEFGNLVQLNQYIKNNNISEYEIDI